MLSNFQCPFMVVNKKLEQIILAIAKHEQRYFLNEIDDFCCINNMTEYFNNFFETLANVECKKTVIFYILIARLLTEKLYNSILLSKNLYNTCLREIDSFKKFYEQLNVYSSQKLLQNADVNSKYVNTNEEIYERNEKKHKRANYSKNISKILKSWLRNNLNSPYPSEIEKTELSKCTGLDQTQINNWFINARRRILPLLKNKNNCD